MNSIPLRIRLMTWYAIILAVSLSFFGLVAALGMRGSIDAMVDDQLQDRMTAVRSLIYTNLAGGATEENIRLLLQRNFELRLGDDLLQVADNDGRWIYRSPSANHYQIPAGVVSDHPATTPQFGPVPVRLLSGIAEYGGKQYQLQVGTGMDELQKATARFRWLSLLTIPMLLALASIGGYWMAERAISPVDQIIRAANSITVNNLASRVEVPQTRDELQRLSETLNGMLERIEMAFKRIRQFTADASHELRTPVTVMRTRTELSLRQRRSEEEYRDALVQNLTEIEHITILVDDLMFLARADSGADGVQHAPVNLTAVVLAAFQEAKPLIRVKAITYLKEIPKVPILVRGDSQLLQRLLLILLDNAVKYTQVRGHITLYLSSGSDTATIKVSDDGIGISEADLPHVFERFYRADKARSRESGGVGLGLAIGKWITDIHAGEIEVESKLGVGTTFSVRLPLTENNLTGKMAVGPEVDIVRLDSF
jgi:heavy metal sensor kinase